MEGVSAITFISIICFFISILLATFLLTVKSENKISNKLFAAFLILSAIDLSAYFHNLFIDSFSILLMAKSTLSFLQMPILYFYVLSVCYSDFKLKPKHLLHSIPFIITNVILTPRFYTKDVAFITNLWKEYSSIPELIFIHFTIHLQFIIYIILFFVILKKYKKIYHQNFSNTASKTHQWLFQFTLVSTIIHSVVILKNILKYVNDTTFSSTMQLIISILALGVICWYVFKALKHPELFNSVNSNTEVIPKKVDTPKEINTEEIEKLTIFMATKKPYLNPSLSIRNLADEMSLNSRDLSVLINQNLNQHFFDFVNGYRIDEAKKLLKDQAKKDFTVLEILYEVGFNSKSSFNTAFKKHTGVTPTQFRKST